MIMVWNLCFLAKWYRAPMNPHRFNTDWNVMTCDLLDLIRRTKMLSTKSWQSIQGSQRKMIRNGFLCYSANSRASSRSWAKITAFEVFSWTFVIHEVRKTNENAFILNSGEHRIMLRPTLNFADTKLFSKTVNIKLDIVHMWHEQAGISKCEHTISGFNHPFFLCESIFDDMEVLMQSHRWANVPGNGINSVSYWK